MSLNIQAQKINFGPLKPTMGTWFWVLVSGALGLILAYSAVYIFFQGQHTLATSDPVPWNIFVSAYIFFVVTSTGLCFISAFGAVFGIEKYELIAKRAVFASLVFLAVGMTAIFLDIGRPWMMYNYAISPNPASPMFWMGVFYGLYFFLLLMELIFIIRGNLKATQFWGTLGFISAVIAHGCLGALLGMIYAKPLWFGPYMPIYFIMSAFVSGLASLSIILIISYKSKNRKMSQRMHELILDMGKVFGYAVCALLFFVFWKNASGIYADKPELHWILYGEYAARFWIGEVLIGLIIPIFILLYKGTRTHFGILIAAIMVIAGLVMARVNLVIIGQLQTPFGQPLGTYSANMLEIMFFAGLFGMFGLIYLVGAYFFQFEEFEDMVSDALDEAGH